jgi:two-component system cell cycle sensor histidine kinase/response regulator CckA
VSKQDPLQQADWSDLFYSAPLGILVLQHDGRIVHQNSFLCTMVGSTPEELAGRTLFDISSGVSPAQLASVREDAPWSTELELRRSDGSNFPAALTITAVRGSEGILLAFLIDVTDRTSTRAVLHSMEEDYLQLINMSPDAIGIYRAGRIVFVNPSAVRIFQARSADELIGKPVIEFVHPDSRAFAVARMTEVVSRGQSVPLVEERFVRLDGTAFDVEVASRPIMFEGQSAVQILVRDISERKRVQQELEITKLSFDIAAIAVLRISKDGLIRSANEFGCSNLGYTGEELCRMHIWEIDPHLRPEHWPEMREAVALGRTMTLESVHQRKDGSTFPVEVTITVVEVEGERSALAFVNDITERKRSEQAIRESEELFRTTLYSIGDGVITTDTAGRVVQMNRVAEKLTGWMEAESTGRSITEVFRIVDETSRAVIDCPVTRVLREAEIVGLPAHALLVARDGRTIPIADSAAPIRNAGGAMTGAVLVFNDQTERRDMQGRLAQAQKLEAVGRFAGGVAHDFNNMIGVIIGYAALIEEGLRPNDPLRQKIQSITVAAERSAALTRQLLAFARKQVIAPVVVNLNDALAALHYMLARMIGEDIELRLQLEPRLWSTNIDPTQVDQIFTNLSSNARDSISDVGTITIETHNCTLRAEDLPAHADVAPGDFVQVMFRDTGRGMDSEVQAKIFEPFFTTKPLGKGTGLGLSTVFGIVKQNNGFITVQSTPGQGSAFAVYLPRVAEAPAAAASPAPPRTNDGSETLLVVEDEQQLLDIVQSSLERRGYRVLAAQTPAEALALGQAHAGRIDLLITDVVMPEMNGKELSTRLSALQPGLPTLFMSGHTAEVVEKRGLLERGISFIAKPFTPAELAQKVREVLIKQ